MIPSVEQICEDLAAGRITVQQAIEWLYEHMRREDQRDIFAAAALQGLLACSRIHEIRDDHISDASADTARWACSIADAMLAERAKA